MILINIFRQCLVKLYEDYWISYWTLHYYRTVVLIVYLRYHKYVSKSNNFFELFQQIWLGFVMMFLDYFTNIVVPNYIGNTNPTLSGRLFTEAFLRWLPPPVVFSALPARRSVHSFCSAFTPVHARTELINRAAKSIRRFR